MNALQYQMLSIDAERVRRSTKSFDKRAAAALMFAHAHAEHSGAIDESTLTTIMVAFGATRELQHG